MGVGGKAVPPNVDKVSDLQSDALFILLVEKDAAFMRLAEDRFYNTYPCIILTAKARQQRMMWCFAFSTGLCIGCFVECMWFCMCRSKVPRQMQASRCTDGYKLPPRCTFSKTFFSQWRRCCSNNFGCHAAACTCPCRASKTSPPTFL